MGTAGWSYKDWEGVLYPKPHPREFDPLTFLSRYVDVVEVNSTFYRPVDPDVARRWVDRVADSDGLATRWTPQQDCIKLILLRLT